MHSLYSFNGWLLKFQWLSSPGSHWLSVLYNSFLSVAVQTIIYCKGNIKIMQRIEPLTFTFADYSNMINTALMTNLEGKWLPYESKNLSSVVTRSNIKIRKRLIPKEHDSSVGNGRDWSLGGCWFDSHLSFKFFLCFKSGGGEFDPTSSIPPPLRSMDFRLTNELNVQQYIILGLAQKRLIIES